MRHQFAAVHELARIEMLAGLPGETLTTIAARMRRESLAPGEAVLAGADERGRFYVLISGMLRGPTGLVVRPGEAVGRGTTIDGPLRAMVPSTVASCDTATFDELLRPLLGAPGGAA
jgi:hypothetical protein